MADITDIITGASDKDLFDGLTRRGVTGTRRLSDGSLRVMLKLHVDDPQPQHKRILRKQSTHVAFHPDEIL